MPGPRACTAVGNLENGAGQHVPLAERWNGNDWEIQLTPTPNGATDSFLSSVSCASASVCSAVGYVQNSAGQKSTLAERWNGREWQIQATPNASGAPDNVLSAVSDARASQPVPVSGVDHELSFPGVDRALEWQQLGGPGRGQPSGRIWQRAIGSVLQHRYGVSRVGNFAAKSTKAGGALSQNTGTV